ncbi:helix-turn-helix domain-containing protein [Listeria seeligeri]|uniref:helix-turn-helix domain-containing protein n=1 Tax=Listeria seeligeri TaxID=1640 RepID=UPI0016250CC8|nr:helix-turn-helix domain-containing protein [Listeria seeligeri]MBC1832267.1 helix-turn-helix domain-containing protein [Listeria seeligeri]
MSSTFTKIQNNVIEDERLNLQDLALYLAICKFANNKTQQCYPSKKSLLEVSRISDKTYRKALNHLIEYGYVKVGKRVGVDGKQLSNLYTLVNMPR